MNEKEYIRLNNIKRTHKEYDPISGLGCVGIRERIYIEDAPYQYINIPIQMKQEPVVTSIIEAGSIQKSHRGKWATLIRNKPISMCGYTFAKQDISTITSFTPLLARL